MCADTRWILNKFFETWDVAHHFELWNWGEKYITYFSRPLLSPSHAVVGLRVIDLCRCYTQTTTPSATRQIEVQFKRIVFLAFLGYGEFHNSHRHSALAKAVPSFERFSRLHQDSTWILFLQYYRALFFSETIHWSGKQPLSLTASHSQGHIIIIVSRRAETSVEISTL